MVTVQGVKFHLVPALLSYLHDNPEGRDVLCLWSANTASQICCLCYADRTVCGDIPLVPHVLKHMCNMDHARNEMEAAQVSFPGEHSETEGFVGLVKGTDRRNAVRNAGVNALVSLGLFNS